MTTRYTEARNAIDAPGAVGSPVERPVRPDVERVMRAVWDLVRSGPNYDGRQQNVEAAIAAAIDRAVAADGERMRSALERIGAWADAYPVEVFPEPLVAWITEGGCECLQRGEGPVRVMPEEDHETGFTVPLYARELSRDPAKGLTVQADADGVWLAFTASTGLHALLNVERIADSHGGIVSKALRDWAADVGKPRGA